MSGTALATGDRLSARQIAVEAGDARAKLLRLLDDPARA